MGCPLLSNGGLTSNGFEGSRTIGYFPGPGGSGGPDESEVEPEPGGRPDELLSTVVRVLCESFEIEESGTLKAGNDKRLAGEILLRSFKEVGSSSKPQS